MGVFISSRIDRICMQMLITLLLLFFPSLDVNYALANLHSYAKNSDEMACDEPHILEDENRVLLEDDLVDDDEW